MFKKAAWCAPFPADERRKLAEFALRNGSKADRKALSALAQAKLAYVKRLFELCPKFRGQCLGIVVPADAPGERKIDVLRKDYAYLFERFFYFVDAKDKEHAGIIVFDELDKSASHILLGQMQAYYRDYQGEMRGAEFRRFYEEADIELKVALEVARARAAAKMTQGELARALGTKQQTISRIEQGAQNVTVETLDRIARALKGALRVSIVVA